MKQKIPKEIRKRTFAIWGAGLLLSLLGLVGEERPGLIIMGIFVMGASVIHHLVFYRCPHCGTFLDRNTGEFCPGCGRRVNERE